MVRFIVSLLSALVILDPYEGLDYEVINVYEIQKEYPEETFEVHYPDPPEPHEFDIDRNLAED